MIRSLTNDPHILVPVPSSQGDTLYNNGSKYTNLGKGTGLQHYRMNAGGTLPEWADLHMPDVKEEIVIKNSEFRVSQADAGKTFEVRDIPVNNLKLTYPIKLDISPVGNPGTWVKFINYASPVEKEYHGITEQPPILRFFLGNVENNLLSGGTISGGYGKNYANAFDGNLNTYAEQTDVTKYMDILYDLGVGNEKTINRIGVYLTGVTTNSMLNISVSIDGINWNYLDHYHFGGDYHPDRVLVEGWNFIHIGFDDKDRSQCYNITGYPYWNTLPKYRYIRVLAMGGYSPPSSTLIKVNEIRAFNDNLYKYFSYMNFYAGDEVTLISDGYQWMVRNSSSVKSVHKLVHSKYVGNDVLWIGETRGSVSSFTNWNPMNELNYDLERNQMYHCRYTFMYYPFHASYGFVFGFMNDHFLVPYLMDFKVKIPTGYPYGNLIQYHTMDFEKAPAPSVTTKAGYYTIATMEGYILSVTSGRLRPAIKCRSNTYGPGMVGGSVEIRKVDNLRINNYYYPLDF